MKTARLFKILDLFVMVNDYCKSRVIKSFFLVFIFSFSYNLSNAQVELGPDIAICKGDSVVLSDLNPSVNPTSGDVKWWTSSGNGVFVPNNSYEDALYYKPGSADTDKFKISLNSGSNKKSVTVYIQGDVLFACNDKITVPLDFHCEHQVTPPALLEGEDEDIPYNLYSVELRDESYNLIPNNTVTVEHIGQNISFYVYHNCSYNACGGSIIVKDNYRPVMNCKTYTITCKIPTSPEEEELGFPIDKSLFPSVEITEDYDYHYTVTDWDACSKVSLTYTDKVESFECADNAVLQKKITRRWEAVDAYNNKSVCNDIINIERIKVEDVKMPPDWNNMDTVALQCDGKWKDSALDNGFPAPEVTGWPEVWGCNIEYNYTDLQFDRCGNTFDIVRKWTIINWCEVDNIIHHNQIIKVVDTTSPVITLDKDTTILDADPYYCGVSSYRLDLPDVKDICSPISDISVKVYDDLNNEFSVQKSGTGYIVNDLHLGVYDVRWKAVDECGNEGSGLSHFKIRDNQNPYAICGEHLVINLSSSGKARLYPQSIDDGSFDNCGIESMEIKKVTSYCYDDYFDFGEYVEFCCSELDSTITVALRVTDFEGNSNSCNAQVTVNDKLPPVIVCPPKIHISCDYYFNSEDLTAYLGTVRENKDWVEDIVIYDYFNQGVVGQDGYAYDNCTVSVTEENDFDISNCNVGRITRTFTASDNGGRENTCQQIIEITNPTPFNADDITWPKSETFYGCSSLDADTSITGAPILDDNSCSIVAVNYVDKMFSVGGDACRKIIRTWTIRDWCQSTNIEWKKEQHITLLNEVAPTFTSDCQNREICVYGKCEGLVELSATAEDDCTPQEELVWRWKLDEGNDGTYDDFGFDNSFSKVMQEGSNKIVWTVEDKCGNISNCSYIFTVRECKKPTPLCIEGLSTSVMNQFGMVSVKAKDFNHFSYDNCTKSNYGECNCETDLRFSFSKDVNDTIYNITCDSIYDGVERIFELKMWVTDRANNQDYCTVQLKVSDNNDVCKDNIQETHSIVGKLYKWSDKTPVSDINIELLRSNTEYIESEKTKNNGEFEFTNLIQDNNYVIKPKDDKPNCILGLSTFDIIQIQRHILGIRKFKSPYQYIAADVNKDSRVSSTDVLYIRKLVLGVTKDFNDNVCWDFVDAKQELTKRNAFSFKNSLNFENLKESINDADFKVVKIGDINDSYLVEQIALELENRDYSKFELFVDNNNYKKGETVAIPIYPANNSSIEGMQFTIVFNKNNLIFDGFEKGELEVQSNSFGTNRLQNGILTFSWNDFKNTKLDKDRPLFTLKFKASNNSHISNDFAINSEVTKALSVIDDKEVAIELSYRNDYDENKFIVYQNTPNPFKEKTSINFVLPKAQEVSIDIFNINGSVIYSQKKYFEEGINRFDLSKSIFKTNGMYYYSISIDKNKITKKMILVD